MKSNTPLNESNWAPPDINSLNFQFDIGESILAEFILSHNLSAIIKELVQNEYDAKGQILKINFGHEFLTVTGSGEPINPPGWQRLSVVLGTGFSSFSQRNIKPKTNGIGSKNFGLRSLFLLGNTIHISSDGKQTVLDLNKGALPKPIKDTHFNKNKGVVIRVPYRTTDRSSLKSFTLEQEKESLERLRNELTPTLIKLAQPNTKKNLNQVIIESERTDREFKWKQTVKAISCMGQNVKALHRRIRMSDSQTSKTQLIEEIEFQKLFSLPQEFKDKKIPTYFKVKNGNVRLALSVRISNGKIEISSPGTFYYPLGVNNSFTGTAISLSAPFEMDMNRTQLTDLQNSPFNSWLIKTLAEFTLELLVEDLFERFGSTIYKAISQSHQPTIPLYIEQLNSKLKAAECWATRAKDTTRKHRSVFASAQNVVLVEKASLDGFLSDNRYLDNEIANDPELRKLSMTAGVKIFTANSLIRLRCAGENSENLKTKLSNSEANYRYNNLNQIKPESTQINFAKALDLQANLSTENKEDLSKTVTTLSADGELRSISDPLWIVDPKIAPVCPIPESQRLHPSLVKFKIFRKLGQTFNITSWIYAMIEKIGVGEASDEERLSLYNYIISESENLSRKLIVALRDVPILRDHLGKWVKPSSIINHDAIGGKQVEEVLHFPHPDYERIAKLAVLFRFRDSITGEDLIKFARLIKSSPRLAAGFEKTLVKFDNLLTKSVVNQLKGIDFLISTHETLSKPNSTYILNRINRICLGPDARYVAGNKTELYKKLGCLEHPKEEDIFKYIIELSERNEKPDNPVYLYEQLIKALKKELTVDYYKDEKIIWIGNTYSCPLDTLIGSYYEKVFLDSIPIVPNFLRELHELYALLGAHKKPQPSHWNEFLSWIDEKYSTSGNQLNDIEKNALRMAYTQSSLPTIPNNTKCLLDRNGKLHDLSEVQNGTFVIDDNPKLSEGIEKACISVTFADVSMDGTISFYENKVKIKRLTEISELIDFKIEGKKQPKSWFRPEMMFDKLHDDSFINAVKKLIDHALKTQPTLTLAELRKRLQGIKKIIFVEILNGIYNVNGEKVEIPLRIVFNADQIQLTEIQSKNDLYGLISIGIAELFTKVVAETRNLADSIFRLISCDSTKEMRDYLYQRGILWEPRSNNDSELTDSEHESEIYTKTEETKQVGEILNSLAQNLVNQSSQTSVESKTAAESKTSETTTEPKPPINPTAPSSTPGPKFILPDLDNVFPQTLEPSGNLRERSSGTKRKGSGNWQPPTSYDTERDNQVGRRGEELVYREVIKQIRSLGLDESRVLKTFVTNPGADHDIKSVNEKGEDVWIEVKSTIGKSGRFNWSKAEFEKALKERKNYILWRVYQADTTTPSFKIFIDPISYLLQNHLRLDIANLYAEVESLDPS